MINENRLIDEFWNDCEEENFTIEATVLLFYLLQLNRQKRTGKVRMHPARLLSKLKGFNEKKVAAASEELQGRGYVEYTPASDSCSSGTYRFLKGMVATNKPTESQPAAKQRV